MAIFSCTQTPDARTLPDGTPVRRSCRYVGNKYYDSGQQDRGLILPRAVGSLSEENLKHCFESVAAHFSAGFESSGTTASLVHISLQGILTVAHVGDSPVSLYLYDDNQKKIVQGLTLTPPHTPESADERKRVMEAGALVDMASNGGCYVHNPGEDGGLALSRAFGDTHTRGIITQPDVIQIDLKEYFEDGLKVVVTVASDGVLEYTTESQRQSVVQLCMALGEEQKIAKELVAFADRSGSTDNITVYAGIFHEPPSTPIVLGVFDGHGQKGRAAADLARREFKKLLSPV